MLKVLILLLFLFICNEGRVVTFRKIPLRPFRHIYIFHRNPNRSFNPILSKNNTSTTQAIHTTTEETTKNVNVDEKYTTPLKLATSDSGQTSEPSGAVSTSIISTTPDLSTSVLYTHSVTPTSESTPASVLDELSSTYSQSTTSVPTQTVTSELSTIHETTRSSTQNTITVPTHTVTSELSTIHETTRSSTQNTVTVPTHTVTSELSTIHETTRSSPGETTRSILASTTSTANSDSSWFSTTTMITTSSSVKTTSTELIIDSNTDSTSPSEKTVPSNVPPTYTISSSEPTYEEQSGDGYGDDEDYDEKSTTVTDLQTTVEEYGSAGGDGEDMDTTTSSEKYRTSTVKRDSITTTGKHSSTIIVAGTTPATNEESSSGEGSGDDNFSGDDIDITEDDFTFEAMEDSFAIQEQKAANPKFLETFSASSSPSEKDNGVDFIPEVINLDNKKRVAHPIIFINKSWTPATNLPTQLKTNDHFSSDLLNSDSWKEIVAASEIISRNSSSDNDNDITTNSVVIEEISTENTNEATDVYITEYILTKPNSTKEHSYDIDSYLDNDIDKDNSANEASYEHFVTVTDVAPNLENKSENKINLLMEMITKYSSKIPTVFATSTSFPDTNTTKLAQDLYNENKVTEKTSLFDKHDDKKPYSVIAEQILKLEHGNLDEDYYIIVDGYDYAPESLNKSEAGHDKIERTKNLNDSTEYVTGNDFENRKNNTIRK
ncbi:hypothetical protein Zmor_023643 [Zophobas morio]|uniref:Zonadhesin n=1 Tax=Zophobas morio TaxID=2755281 RepID=A0AA38I1F4_9CUCU|nr:hypothetical protein Zmor_023643 [Zophobas morio]